jgi:hypothetical protein
VNAFETFSTRRQQDTPLSAANTKPPTSALVSTSLSPEFIQASTTPHPLRASPLRPQTSTFHTASASHHSFPTYFGRPVSSPPV